MQVVHEVCCGLDVHKKSVTACVLWASGRRRQTREFGTFTKDLLEMSDWLQRCGVTHVAMESTGVYWKPVLLVGSVSSVGSAEGKQTRHHRRSPQSLGHRLLPSARPDLLPRPRPRLLRSPEPRRPAPALNQTTGRFGLQSNRGALNPSRLEAIF